jgi:hypothetical protein
MESLLSEVVSLTIYKLASLSAGVSCVYMGYLLFTKGIWGDSGDIEGKFRDTQIVIKSAAPGTIFALVGLFVICFTVMKGMQFPKEIEINEVFEKSDTSKIVGPFALPEKLPR